MAAAVVDVADFARWRLVVVENWPVAWSRVLDSTRAFGLLYVTPKCSRDAARGPGARPKRIPAQEVFFRQLLHISWAEPPAPVSNEAATVHQRRSTASWRWCPVHDREQVVRLSRAVRYRSPRWCHLRVRRTSSHRPGPMMRMSRPSALWSFEWLRLSRRATPSWARGPTRR